MGIECGSQIILCDLPVRIDTYSGCSHGCKYCFVKSKKDIAQIKPEKCSESLRRFIKGHRSLDVQWCDWDIPLHWGGVSDPFQPAEKRYRASFDVLNVFAETQYPFVFSTKGKLVTDTEYISVIRDCRCVAQISMVCSKYDVMEQGAPTYKQRLKMCEILSKNTLRVISRVQPYMPEVRGDILKNIPKLKNSGVYGIVFEGMKFKKRMNGTVKVGGDWCYPKDVLERDFKILRHACRENGLRFFAGENRLRTMGDSMCCCGVEGLEGFIGNSFNIVHLKAGDKVSPTEKMKMVGTANCFHTLGQNTANDRRLKQCSFFSLMMEKFKEGRCGV